jgi:hypothetical protein
MTFKVVKFICFLVVMTIMLFVLFIKIMIAEEYKKKENNSLSIWLNNILNVILIENLILSVYIFSSLSDD